MADGLRLLAPLLLAAYLGVTFVWRSYRVWRQTGVNPYVLSREDDAAGVIARSFRLVLLLLAAVVGVYAASERGYALVAPFGWLERPLGQGFGVALLAASVGLIVWRRTRRLAQGFVLGAAIGLVVAGGLCIPLVSTF